MESERGEVMLRRKETPALKNSVLFNVPWFVQNVAGSGVAALAKRTFRRAQQPIAPCT